MFQKKGWGGDFVHSSLVNNANIVFEILKCCKKWGGGHFVQNSKFTIHRDIISVIKLIGTNLFSRIEFCFI